MSDLVLYRDGQPVNLNDHPSLLASLHASDRAIKQIDDEIAAIEKERALLTEKIELMDEMGLSNPGVKSKRTRLGHRLGALKRRRAAHQRNYLEVPDMGGHRIWMDNTTHFQQLSADVPVDVLRALKHAKEQGIFDEFKVYEPPFQGTDPMIVGVAGDACFYIASWR